MKACNSYSLFSVYWENAKHAHRILKFDFNFFPTSVAEYSARDMSRYVEQKLIFFQCIIKTEEKKFLFIQFYCIFLLFWCRVFVFFTTDLPCNYVWHFFYPSLFLSAMHWIYFVDEIFLALNNKNKIMKRLIIEIDSLIFLIENLNGKKMCV